MQMYNPPVPGEILFEDYLKPLGIEAAEFADRLGVDIADMNDLLAGRSPVPADLALRLGTMLSTTKPAPFTDSDPVMLAVLDYFEQDMLRHPEKVVLLSESLMARMQQAVEGVPLPDAEDDFEMDEAEYAEYAELAAEAQAECEFVSEYFDKP